MFIARKSFDLGVCLAGYWAGTMIGGWGGGILLAFVALLVSARVWDLGASLIWGGETQVSLQLDYLIAAASAAIVLAAAFAYWGAY